jgi:hypothetical protein
MRRGKNKRIVHRPPIVKARQNQARVLNMRQKCAAVAIAKRAQNINAEGVEGT